MTGYREARTLAIVYRVLAVLVAVGTIALVLVGARMAATLALLAAERNIAVEPYNPLPLVAGGLLLALALYTAGALLSLMADMATAQRETADVMKRMRRRD